MRRPANICRVSITLRGVIHCYITKKARSLAPFATLSDITVQVNMVEIRRKKNLTSYPKKRDVAKDNTLCRAASFIGVKLVRLQRLRKEPPRNTTDRSKYQILLERFAAGESYDLERPILR